MVIRTMENSLKEISMEKVDFLFFSLFINIFIYKGRLSNLNGNSYEGNFKDGKRSGRGKKERKMDCYDFFQFLNQASNFGPMVTFIKETGKMD